jgi:hypothetical protein
MSGFRSSSRFVNISGYRRTPLKSSGLLYRLLYIGPLVHRCASGSIPVSRTRLYAVQSQYLDSLHKTRGQYQDDWVGAERKAPTNGTSRHAPTQPPSDGLPTRPSLVCRSMGVLLGPVWLYLGVIVAALTGVASMAVASKRAMRRPL